MSKWDEGVLFKCPCGREKYIRLSNVKNTKSCGCHQKESIVGKSFGFLKVLRLATDEDRFKFGVICECACGVEICLPQGTTRKRVSCGTCNLPVRLSIKEPSFDPYDLSQSSPTEDPRYATYTGAKYRCREDGHKDYGKRGIRFLWVDFKDFCDDMGERPEGYTLERVDVNGHYCKENCTWADWETQSNNKRTNRFVTVGDLTMTIAQWERYTGLSKGQVRYRVNLYGWSIEDACSLASKKKVPDKLITLGGKTLTTSEWEDIGGLSRGTINRRIRNGWSEERACLEPIKVAREIKALGQWKTIAEWERFYGLASDTIGARIRSGRWTEEEACSKGNCISK
jgi:hypothetical protein